MNIEYVKSVIGSYEIECICKTGSQVYCTDGELHDTDYLVTINDWCYDYVRYNYEGVDYFCYSCSYWNYLCENFMTQSCKIIFFESYVNDSHNIVYGSRTDHFMLLDRVDMYLAWYHSHKYEFLLQRGFSFKLGKYRYHNLIFGLIPYYWIQNGSYVLTERQQDTINRLHAKSVEEKELRELIDLL